MRGVEAALRLVEGVDRGEFLSEALRRLASEKIGTPEDLSLAATLAYAVFRRKALWERLVREALTPPRRDPSPGAMRALVVGAAGLCTLRTFAPAALGNALVEYVRRLSPREGALVNAVLRRIEPRGISLMERLGASGALLDQALFRGVPDWAARRFEEDFGPSGARQLVKMASIRPYTSFCLSPGESPQGWAERLGEAGLRAWPSPALSGVLRTAATPHIPSVPGFLQGALSPQTESSMRVSELALSLAGDGPVLDMCAGRGGKTAHLISRLPAGAVEAWEKSPGRCRAFRGEMARRHLVGAVIEGDALALEASRRYRLVLVDAPCSGSGTWGRHPEAKWRVTPSEVGALAALQRRLLARGASLAASGGYVLYATCSLFREENEAVVADVLARDPSVVEVPVLTGKAPWRRGRPWGFSIFPALPWVDGFYVTVLMKVSA